MRWTSSRTINAPVERVFRTVADPDEFSASDPRRLERRVPDPNRTGVGVRFRATRLIKGKPSTFEQEVTEFAPPEQVRLVNVTHGTVWDSTFRLQSDGGRRC